MRITESTIRRIILEEIEEAKRRGLWANIRARRAAGKRPHRPGEKGYPETLDIDEDLTEGILDGTSGSTRASPTPPDVRAANRQRDLDNAKRMGDAAAKKLTPAVTPKKPEIQKMPVADVKKMVNDFGKDKKTIDKEDTKVATAAVLNLSKRDAQGATDMLSTMKSNPKLRAAVGSTPGMSDMQSAVDTRLKAGGKDPSTAIGDSWRELGKLTSKYNLSEAILEIIEEEATLEATKRF